MQRPVCSAVGARLALIRPPLLGASQLAPPHNCPPWAGDPPTPPPTGTQEPAFQVLREDSLWPMCSCVERFLCACSIHPTRCVRAVLLLQLQCLEQCWLMVDYMCLNEWMHYHWGSCVLVLQWKYQEYMDYNIRMDLCLIYTVFISWAQSKWC